MKDSGWSPGRVSWLAVSVMLAIAFQPIAGIIPRVALPRCIRSLLASRRNQLGYGTARYPDEASMSSYGIRFMFISNFIANKEECSMQVDAYS